MAQRYRKSPGSVYDLRLHLVFCPKYRRSVLTGKVASRLEALIREKAATLEADVIALEVMPDHVHLFVSVPPTYAPQHLANQVKGYSSRVLRQEFPDLKSRLPALWSRSYFVASTGTVSSETADLRSAIKAYIEAQKGV